MDTSLKIPEKYFDEFITLVSTLKSEKDVKDFFQGILTPKEIEEICVRLQIITLLKQGIPHAKISQLLGVGIATVTRGSHEIKKGRFDNLSTSSWRPSTSK